MGDRSKSRKAKASKLSINRQVHGKDVGAAPDFQQAVWTVAVPARAAADWCTERPATGECSLEVGFWVFLQPNVLFRHCQNCNIRAAEAREGIEATKNACFTRGIEQVTKGRQVKAGCLYLMRYMLLLCHHAFVRGGAITRRISRLVQLTTTPGMANRDQRLAPSALCPETMQASSFAQMTSHPGILTSTSNMPCLVQMLGREGLSGAYRQGTQRW